MARFFFLLIVCAVIGCKHPIPEPVFPPITGPVIPGPEGCDEEVIFFQQQVLPIFQSSCAMPSCHDAATAKDGVVLDSYANIMNTGEIIAGNPDDSEVYEKITEDDADDIMPPPGNNPLTEAQINTIYNWIVQGAMNNSCEGSGCDTLNVTWALKVKPIVDLHCKNCHSGASPQGGFALENYTQVKAIVENGSMWSAINWTGPYIQMPYNGNKLPDCKIDIIGSWIADGAPNN